MIEFITGVSFVFMVFALFIMLIIAIGWREGQSEKPFYVLGSIVVISFISLVASGIAWNKLPTYQYTVKLHYIDGSTDTVKCESKRYPEIQSSYGDYSFCCNGMRIPGVYRFEVLSKKEIEK